MSLRELLTSVYRVSWGDMCTIRRNLPSILVSSLVIPVLYLVGFGYGIGGAMSADGHDYLAFLFPGIIAMTSLTASFSYTSSKIYIQKSFYRSIDEMLLCPIPTPSIVIGKAMMGLIRGLLSCAILIAIASLMSSDFILSAGLIAMTVLCCLTFSFLGVAAGLVMKRHSDINLFNSLVITPMTFLCGTLFSLSALPAAIRYAVGVLPLTHAVDTIGALALGTGFPWVSFGIILAFTVAFYSIAHAVVRRGNLG